MRTTTHVFRLALVGLLAAACTPTTTEPVPTRAPASGETGTGPVIAAPSGGETVEGAVALDGDSIEGTVDGVSIEIRLLGINTPERTECWAAEARAATAAMLDGADVTVEDLGTDRFDRMLGYVTAGDLFVNAELVAAGHAMRITNEHDYERDFADLEQAAYESRAGLWAPDACGPPTDADVRIEEVDGDPRGSDDDPRTGESVLIRNHGGEDADLNGWVLRDESSTHRYEFPGGTVLSPGEEIRVFSICGVHDHCFGDWDTVWSNGGDTALLLDGHGNVVDRLRFSG